MVLSFYVQSWLLLVPLIPSILISIFILYHLLKNPLLRNTLNNHVIIWLLLFGLISELTDLTFHVQFYRTGIVPIQTRSFCIFWVTISSSVLVAIYWLMAWASIERHIFIFHRHWFGTRRRRLLFHYLPLSLCVIGPTIFYLFAFLVVPCEVPFRYNLEFCLRYFCIINVSWLALLDGIVNNIIPAYVIIIFSVALLIRVLYRRYLTRQRIDWRNYKKLASQLLPISFLYLFLQLPPLTLYIAYSAGLSRNVASNYYLDSLFFANGIILFTPFASIHSLPNLRIKLKNLVFFWRKRFIVAPQHMKMNRMQANQTATR